MNTYQILVPVDFSDASASALSVAMGIAAGRQPATVSALHVVPGIVPYHDEHLGVFEPTRCLNSLRMQAMENSVPSDVPVTELVTYGDPVTEIVERAEALKSDLIVMGTHGRTGLDRLLMGSVSEGVLRNARCSVLFVKARSGSQGDSAVFRQSKVESTGTPGL